MNGDGRDDAALVAAVLAGDSAAFGSIYDRYADRIHDYAFSLLRQPTDAADVMQDTFLTASQRLTQLRDPSRLRPWLYSIARSFVFALSRGRQRTVVSDEVDEVVEMTDTDGSLDAVDLVWAAAAGLEISDRDVLDLHLRQGLDGQDLADALGVTRNAANVMLHRVRERMEQSVGAVLLARSSRGECPELDALVADGLSPLVRKRVARHVESCEICGDRRTRATSASALFSLSSVVAAPLALRPVVLERVGTGHAVDAASRLSWNAEGFPVGEPVVAPEVHPASRAMQRVGARSNWWVAAASAVVLIVALAAMFVFVRSGNEGDELVSAPPLGSTTSVDPSVLDSTVPGSIANGVSVVPTSITGTDSTVSAPMVTEVPNGTVVSPSVPPSTPPSATDVSTVAPSVVPPTPPTITVVDYQCASTMVVVVDITGAPPLSADLRFVEDGATVPFDSDPGRPGRFSVSVTLSKSSVTPQVVARSGATASRSESTTMQLERCVVLD